MATINRYGGVSGGYGPKVKVFYQGPFFEHDPAKTMRQNKQAFIESVMTDAYRTAVNAAPERSGDYLWALRDGPALRFGRVDNSRKWQVTGVLTMRKLAHPWHLGAVGSEKHSKHWYRYGRSGVGVRSGGYFNYAGKVEAKYHVFAKARATVRSARRYYNNLLKGLT